jgi:conjugative relaxase-like TrwC/TraI family protein
MLSIGKLGKGQERYYLDKVAEGAEDYYSGEGEVAGQWLGDAAEDLGLSGDVEAAQLEAMLTGCNPVDGEPLVGRRGVPTSGSVPGFDHTFSVPKSVSLLWGLGGPVAAVEVSTAHREAVGAALGYLQREACWTRRGAGGSEFVKGNGYLAAAYVHRSSRAGDPQLHTHVLVANATKGPDGRWTRLYHPAIYDHAKTASYIYEAHLRHELTRRLGVEWQPTRKGIAEIAGFADEHLRAFSTRRQQILEAAGADASARSMQVAALTTRQPKERDVGRGELLERWRSRAQEIGLDRETIARTFDPEALLKIERADAPVVSAARLARSVTASASHFDRREAIQAVADSLPQGATGAEVEQLAYAFLASESVIQIAETAKGPRYTTRRIWELEREALAAVERMRAQGPTPAGELIAARVIGARPTLKDDQREMVHRLLTAPEGVAVVIGEAGSGKTFAVVAAAEGWAQAGIELRAAAPTWRAANVMRAEGLPAQSIASLLLQLDRAEREGAEGLPRESVLLIDEAGMVDSATLARLVSHAEAAQAKLVLVGDPEQLGEIEAGGLFRAVAERADPIHLDEVIRHSHELDREAAKRIREGKGREALNLYRSSERVTVAPNAEERREAMVRDWHESFQRGEDAVMVAKRNAEVARLNEIAREVRRQAGALGESEIEVGEARFVAGDQVITRVNDQAAGVFNRERWRVAEVDAAEGRVVLEGIDQAKAVEIGPDYLARTNPYSDAPALEHAYAVTTYSAQGTTVDRAFVAADPSMDKQELYVAASRSREETYIYATPEIQTQREEIAPQSSHLREGIPHIGEAAERDRSQLAAHDEALRSQFAGLPTEELVFRRDELRPAAIREERAEGQRRRLRERIAEAREHVESLAAEREAAQALPRHQRRDELARLGSREAWSRDGIEQLEARLRDMPVAGDAGNREMAVADRVLTQRRELAIIAARISPPPYVKAELGERPSEPAKRKAWDRGVSEIERYRQEHGVKDPKRALGQEAKRGAERARQQATLRRIHEMQRVLGLGQHAARARQLGGGLGIGR